MSTRPVTRLEKRSCERTGPRGMAATVPMLAGDPKVISDTSRASKAACLPQMVEWVELTPENATNVHVYPLALADSLLQMPTELIGASIARESTVHKSSSVSFSFEIREVLLANQRH